MVPGITAVLTAFIDLDGNLNSGGFPIHMVFEMTTVLCYVNEILHLIDISEVDFLETKIFVVLIVPYGLLGTGLKTL